MWFRGLNKRRTNLSVPSLIQYKHFWHLLQVKVCVISIYSIWQYFKYVNSWLVEAVNRRLPRIDHRGIIQWRLWIIEISLFYDIFLSLILLQINFWTIFLVNIGRKKIFTFCLLKCKQKKNHHYQHLILNIFLSTFIIKLSQ